MKEYLIRVKNENDQVEDLFYIDEEESLLDKIYELQNEDEYFIVYELKCIKKYEGND